MKRYNPPSGAFVVVRAGPDVVGCGAVLHLDAATAEIKRMWVAPSSRGTGLGRRLLHRQVGRRFLTVHAGRGEQPGVVLVGEHRSSASSFRHRTDQGEQVVRRVAGEAQQLAGVGHLHCDPVFGWGLLRMNRLELTEKAGLPPQKAATPDSSRDATGTPAESIAD